jgi:FOG: CheY-like receiver
MFGFGSKSSTPSSSGQPKHIRVLVIDDDAQFLQFIRDLFKSDRFEVVATNSSVKALELFSRDAQGFDLVLLDYFMPHLNGAETFEWLRKLNPNVKVIICSGAEELQLRQIATQYGINGYIRKPFNMNEVLDLINKVVSEPTAGT